MLVARGFEEEDMIQLDYPTTSKAVIRICLIIAADKQWTTKTTVIKSAFLQGKELSVDVYLTPSIESVVFKCIISKQRQFVYGLKDGANSFT